MSRVRGNSHARFEGPRRREAPGLPDNTATDHIAVLDAALTQIPDVYRHGHPILGRADGAGCTKAFLAHVRALHTTGVSCEFSVGWTITGREHTAIAALRAGDWTPALDAEGEPLSAGGRRRRRDHGTAAGLNTGGLPDRDAGDRAP